MRINFESKYSIYTNKIHTNTLEGSSIYIVRGGVKTNKFLNIYNSIRQQIINKRF